MRSRRAVERARNATHLALAVLLVVLFVAPWASASAGGSRTVAGPIPGARPSSNGPFTATVSWNGANVTRAGSVSSAFSVTPGQTANVTFQYHPTSEVPVDMANASLVLTYLGLALTTNTVLFHPTLTGGAATVNWSFGALSELTAGVYQLEAKFINSTGATVFSEAFYIDVKAPYYGLGAGLPAFLVVLGLAEAYWIAASIRSARRHARGPLVRKAGGDPHSTTGEPGAPGSTLPEAQPPPGPGASPPPSPPPPPGGSS